VPKILLGASLTLPIDEELPLFQVGKRRKVNHTPEREGSRAIKRP